MAAAPCAAPGPRSLRRDSALTAGTDDPDRPGRRPFEVEPERLYEVGRHGSVWTEAASDPRHLIRLRWSFALALALNAVTWGLAGLALVVGGQEWGALAGLLALLTLPLLGLPVLLDAVARIRGRRRHRVRPEDFG